jgi:hypothetical protein
MIRVCMEVHEGAASRKVEIQAGSISRAVSITKGRYPDSDVRVVFPIDPAEFFVKTAGYGGSRMKLLPERSC